MAVARTGATIGELLERALDPVGELAAAVELEISRLEIAEGESGVGSSGATNGKHGAFSIPPVVGDVHAAPERARVPNAGLTGGAPRRQTQIDNALNELGIAQAGFFRRPGAIFSTCDRRVRVGLEHVDPVFGIEAQIQAGIAA